MVKVSYAMTEWADQLKYVNRYQLTEDQENFVSYAVEHIASSHCTIDAGTKYYRARKHRIGQSDPYPIAVMGAPPAHLHKGGRCSPPGIPCLYLSSDPETAISEVRPWKGAQMSVASFVVREGIRLVDLRESWRPKPKKDQRNVAGEAAAILVLTKSFERPGHEESEIEYVPTQFLSSIFKSLGFHGIIYSSLMNSSGHNVALFDPSFAIGEAVDLYDVNSVSYWTSKVEEPNQTVEPTPIAGAVPAQQET